MRRLLGIVTALAVVGGGVGVAATPQKGAIRGNVTDVTCYGPCTVDGDSRPFDGPGKAVVRDLVADRRVATSRFRGAAFGVGIDPGTYRVRVIPYPGDDRQRRCWSGSRRRVVVSPGEAQVVRLTVQNSCILRG